jgi:hypothetical protein
MLVELYKKDIAEATRLTTLNEDVKEPKENVTRSAREATKMAFELFCAGEYTKEEWEKAAGPFNRYKPVRATYQRSSTTLEALAETAASQKESILQ